MINFKLELITVLTNNTKSIQIPKHVAKNHIAILCDNCDLWAHVKFENISNKKYENYSNDMQLNCFNINDEVNQVTSAQNVFIFQDHDLNDTNGVLRVSQNHLMKTSKQYTN